MVSFPEDRSFVLYLSAESDAALDRIIGRVEHIDSGRRARIGSRKELWEFIARVLREERDGFPGCETG